MEQGVAGWRMARHHGNTDVCVLMSGTCPAVTAIDSSRTPSGAYRYRQVLPTLRRSSRRGAGAIERAALELAPSRSIPCCAEALGADSGAWSSFGGATFATANLIGAQRETELFPPTRDHIFLETRPQEMSCTRKTDPLQSAHSKCECRVLL